MRDIEGPGRTGISCRGDSPLFSLQLCKLGWFNQSNFTARLKLTVVQEQLLDVSCRINVDGDTVVVPAGAATSITLLDIKPSRKALSEAKIIQRTDERLCIRRPPNATYRRHGSCYTIIGQPPTVVTQVILFIPGAEKALERLVLRHFGLVPCLLLLLLSALLCIEYLQNCRIEGKEREKYLRARLNSGEARAKVRDEQVRLAATDILIAQQQKAPAQQTALA